MFETFSRCSVMLSYTHTIFIRSVLQLDHFLGSDSYHSYLSICQTVTIKVSTRIMSGTPERTQIKLLICSNLSWMVS